MNCRICGSFAINHDLHGRDRSDPGLCDVCYWRKRADKVIARSLETYIETQKNWSKETFGPGDRDAGIIDHIKKELKEIQAAPDDLEEWIDVIILALDGAWRHGYSPANIVNVLFKKQAKNLAREWPDWRTAEPGKAIEHIRDGADA